jgi:hypothetical protein
MEILSPFINRQIAEKLQEKKSPCAGDALEEEKAIGYTDDRSSEKCDKRG